jgi:hypothetical protein
MKMKTKAKIKYFGKFGFCFLWVLFASLLLIYGVIHQIFFEGFGKPVLFFVFPLLLITASVFVHKLFRDYRSIEIVDKKLIFQNKITAKIDTYPLHVIKGFRHNNFIDDVFILDNQDNVITKLHAPFFVEIDEFLKRNEIKYLGRSQSLLSK